MRKIIKCIDNLVINQLVRTSAEICEYLDSRFVKMFCNRSGTACTPALTIIALTDNIPAAVICIIDKPSQIICKIKCTAEFFIFTLRPYINIIIRAVINIAAYSIVVYVLRAKVIKNDNRYIFRECFCCKSIVC